MPESTGMPETAPPTGATEPAGPADDSFVIVTPVEVVVTPIPAEEPPAPPEDDEDTVLADVEASGSTTGTAAQPPGDSPDPDDPDPNEEESST